MVKDQNDLNLLWVKWPYLITSHCDIAICELLWVRYKGSTSLRSLFRTSLPFEIEMQFWNAKFKILQNLLICRLRRAFFSLPTVVEKNKSLRQKLCPWHAFLYQSLLNDSAEMGWKMLTNKGKVFYGQEPPSGESTTTESGVNYQLLSVMHWSSSLGNS